MKIHVADKGKVIVVPESTDETGVMAWLSNRFKDKKVTLTFDTTSIGMNDYYPALWLYSADSEEVDK